MRPEHDVVLGDRYVLTHPIAVGGMGEVWEATDRMLGRTVAVKILKDELRTAPAFLVRFRAEARHAAGLSHPGIAKVYDYGETGDGAYLVMEFVPGKTLSQLLVEQPNLPNDTKLSILSQTAQALHAAHLAGVIHRDVKPANLIVGPDGSVKVTDFGIARAIGAASLTDAGQVVGTAQYMSPEQATGNQATAASDIYSLGVIAYEMFAGRRPYDADTPLAVSMAHVHAPVPTLPAGVPRGVADLIADALSKDPGSRPATGEIFALRARREMSTGRPAPTLEIPATTMTSVQPSMTQAAGHERTDDPRRSRAAPLLAFLALFMLIVGAAWVLAARGNGDPPAQADPLTSDVAAATDAVPSTAPATTTPPTIPPATTAPSTPAVTAPVITEVTVTAATTIPPMPTTAAPEPPATPVPTTAAAVTAAPVVLPTSGPGPIGEDEAVDFVLTYYDQVEAGDYEASWPKLTPEFRAARNLTFESYARYWRNTSLELSDLQYTPGPSSDEGRLRFAAQYTTSGRVVNETDEITLHREPDGRLVITDQRIVS